MSRWLANVGQFLEKLDDRAGQRLTQSEGLEDEPFGQGKESIESILAARGINTSATKDDDDDDDDIIESEHNADDNNVQVDSSTLNENTHESDQLASFDKIPNDNNNDTNISDEQQDTLLSASENSVLDQGSTQDEPGLVNADLTDINIESNIVAENTGDNENESIPVSSEDKVEFGNDTLPPDMHTETLDNPPVSSKDSEESTNNNEISKSTSSFPGTNASTNSISSDMQNSNHNKPSNTITTVIDPKLQQTIREAQKEARMLRRHVVTLNTQLEQTEAEMQAQRVELERAAERLEKDRLRHKTEREAERQRHTSEMQQLCAQQEAAINDIRQRSNASIEQVRREMTELEQRRMQEGGNWDKELAESLRREQDLGQQIAHFKDEKATMLAQITTLQNQQETLGSRLESLMQSADSSMERERDAENRLDEALSLHAKQISQRQAREAELERTIAEMSAALVAARNEASRSASNANVFDGNTDDLDRQSKSLLQEVELLTSQLESEKQYNASLKQEIKEINSERCEETVLHNRRVMHYDRQVSEQTNTISRLQAELEQSKVREKPQAFAANNEDHYNEVKSLSEEILRMRERLSASNSELAATKGRLSAATIKLTELEAMGNKENSTFNHRDIENNLYRGSLGETRQRGGRSKQNFTAMREALQIGGSFDNRRERLGQALDGIDAFLASSGKILRSNPVARLMFISYLLILHAWTFILVISHAHRIEAFHGDFGNNGGLPTGPQALMKQSINTSNKH